MYHSIVASALSIKPTKWDKAQNADKLEAFIREAARERPDVIVAPEGFLEGYVVMEVVRDPSKAEAMHALAEPLDGPYIQRFQSVARSLKRNICFGFAERRDDGIYNCAAFIGSDGELCGTYRKTQLSEGTHPSWDFNRVGRRLRGIDTPIGRVGVLICNDRWNAHIARTQVMDGAQLLLIPSFGSRKRAQNEAVMARARENSVPVVEAAVGVNLIISKGEVVAYTWGVDRITTARIEIPSWPAPALADDMEHAYLAGQDAEMLRRHRHMMEELRQDAAAQRASAG